MSEHAAYGRIEAARAARRFPVILKRLAEGTINLTAIGLMAPHLTPANHLELLDAARHKSKRDIEELVARLRPRPDVPAAVRRLPQRAAEKSWSEQATLNACQPDAALPAAAQPKGAVKPAAKIEPLAPERYKIQLTVSRETYEQLRRAQDLMRHTIPDGDPARSRHIPATVKRAVWQRDGGRCAFEGSQGRCTETGFLEYHHRVPFAAGGDTTTENVSLRCRAHNAYEAEREFPVLGPPICREHREEYWAGPATGSGPRSFGEHRFP